MRAALRVLLATSFAITSSVSSTASAASAPDAAVREGFEISNAAMGAMRQLGWTFETLLSAERLPSGDWLAEVSLRRGELAVRLPVKLSRAGSEWSVLWEPVADYGKGLASIAQSGALPAAPGERWAEIRRMPALPVIVTQKRIITPFGVADPNEAADGPASGGLAQLGTIVRHGQRWVSETLADDPAPAALDVMADAKVSWHALFRVLFSLGSAGLWQTYIVTADGSAVRVASPIAATPGDGRTVAALFPVDGRWGFRFVVDGEPADVGAAPGCPAMTFCAENAGEFFGGLERVLEPGGTRATFAALATARVGDVLPFVAAFADYRGLGPHALVISYVPEAQ